MRQFSTSGSRRDTLQRCAFCRASVSSTPREFEQRLLKRRDCNDKTAIFMLYCCYVKGRFGVGRNISKGLEMLGQAAELGHPDALYDLATAYHFGKLRFVDNDTDIDYEQNLGKAITLYDRCLALGTSREHGPALLNRGVLAYKVGDYGTARGCYRQAAVQFGLRGAMDNYTSMHAEGVGGISKFDVAEVQAIYDQHQAATR